MDKKQDSQGLRVRAAELFDLPVDLVAGLCHTEILGDRQLFLEGHSGILSYDTKRIDVSAGKLIVRVEGEGLTLRSMTGDDVRIAGTIRSVSFER